MPASGAARPGCRTRGGQGIEHILVCLDGSAISESCLPASIALANAFAARITLLHVLETGNATEPADALAWELRREELRGYLDGILERLDRTGLAAAVHLAEGRPAEQILAQAAELGADLIVVATHGHRGLSEWCLASTAYKVLTLAPASVLVVPAVPAGDAPELAPRRIIVPLDGSPRAECVLPAATRISSAHDAELLLVHVVREPQLAPLVFPSPADAALARELADRNETGARTYLGRVATRLDRDHVRSRLDVARAPDVSRKLLEITRREAGDLLVLTAHGTGSDASCTCGGVARNLVSLGSVPLLMVQDMSPLELGRPTHSSRRAPMTPGELRFGMS